MKEYRNMQSDEQTQWVMLFSEFLTNDYANVKAQGDGWRESFERGLKVLEPMSMCQQFVKRSRQYRDYDRRIDRMAFFIEELRKQVIAVDGSLLAQAAAPQKRRRGRPTQAEVIEREKMRMMDESGKMKAVGVVAGVKDSSESRVESLENPKAKGDKEPELIGDLFNDNKRDNAPISHPSSSSSQDFSSEPSSSRSQDFSSESPSSSSANFSSPHPTLSLRDLKPFLSGELQDLVDSVAVLRSEVTIESEKAKDLALKGGSEKEIAAHAQAAAEAEEKVNRIYALVDIEMAKVYIRTRMSKEEKVMGEKRDALLQKAEPYYQKVTASQPTFEGIYLAKLAAEKEKEEKEKKSGLTTKERKRLLKNYHDYFYRKDVKPSEQRIKKMEEKIAHLKELGEEVEDYEVILENERKKVNNNS